jgi:hypothetical protein
MFLPGINSGWNFKVKRLPVAEGAFLEGDMV